MCFSHQTKVIYYIRRKYLKCLFLPPYFSFKGQNVEFRGDFALCTWLFLMPLSTTVMHTEQSDYNVDMSYPDWLCVRNGYAFVL